MQEIAPAPATTLDPTQREIARRRTFAIISHPDAGKTTLTEKLLLFGGAIQMAGHVRARGERRRTWPAIWMAPPNSSSFSVRVVLPASGCEMIANVRRRAASAATRAASGPATLSSRGRGPRT